MVIERMSDVTYSRWRCRVSVRVRRSQTQFCNRSLVVMLPTGCCDEAKSYHFGSKN